MSSQVEYFRGEACGDGNCKSRRYFEGDDGFVYCKNGHMREGYRATQQDEDDFGNQGRISRRKREVQEKTSRIFHGSKAFEVYLQSYQLILWKQCHALVHTIGLPAELENVVKNLWALRLQLLKDRTLVDSDGDTVFSSQARTEDDEIESKSKYGQAWKARAKAIPTILETLGLCYLGTVLLRLPLSLGDMHSWAFKEDVPYIRAVRFIPKAMKDQLPGYYIGALDTQTALEPDDLHIAVHKLSLLYNHQFDLVLPALNHPLLLFKHIKSLALPIELYIVVRRLASLLAVDFTFPKPGSRQRKSSLPEIQLVSLLLIAVKLYHPFDSQPRHGRSLTEFGTLVIDWDSWGKSKIEYAARHQSARSLGRGNEINVNENDIMDMSGEQLDEYLDWYEKTWVKEDSQQSSARRIPQPLLDMFPTGRPDGSSPVKVDFRQEAQADRIGLDQMLNTAVGSLQFRGIVLEESADSSDDSVRRIGSFYKRYRTIEDLSPQARMFYEAAANSVGTSLTTLTIAVFQMERKLETFGKKEAEDYLPEEEDLLREEERLEGDQAVPKIYEGEMTAGGQEPYQGSLEPEEDSENNIVASDIEPEVLASEPDTTEHY